MKNLSLILVLTLTSMFALANEARAGLLEPIPWTLEGAGDPTCLGSGTSLGQGDEGGSGAECSCQASATCEEGPPYSLSCQDTTSPCNCTGVDQDCDSGQRGYVRCNGVTTYCDECPECLPIGNCSGQGNPNLFCATKCDYVCDIPEGYCNQFTDLCVCGLE